MRFIPAGAKNSRHENGFLPVNPAAAGFFMWPAGGFDRLRTKPYS